MSLTSVKKIVADTNVEVLSAEDRFYRCADVLINGWMDWQMDGW